MRYPSPQTNNSKPESGFTLIELLVYMAIASAVFLGLTQLLIGSLATRDRVVARRELQDTVRLLETSFKQDIRWGDSIDQAETGLLVLTASGNEIRYSLNSGAILRQRDSDAPELLTGSSTEVTGLVFEKISPLTVGAPDSVKIRFAARQKSPRGVEPEITVDLTLTGREGS